MILLIKTAIVGFGANFAIFHMRFTFWIAGEKPMNVYMLICCSALVALVLVYNLVPLAFA